MIELGKPSLHGPRIVAQKHDGTATITFSRDGLWLTSQGKDRCVRLWGNGSMIGGFAVDGRHFVCATPQWVNVWNIEDEPRDAVHHFEITPAFRFNFPQPGIPQPTAVHLLLGEEPLVFVGDCEGNLRVLKAKNGYLIKQIPLEGGAIQALQIFDKNLVVHMQNDERYTILLSQ